ncbi:MAG TPA: methyltransferase domain-containing protein [Ferruginibacter sp.]|nr:methyltransferase domain-containing protein [Ferruginibacter sp.]HMP20529.1 methyltransferase domain-containing protein [Ferruginibacter sp.]
MNAAPFEYIGNELELFAAAKNWKRYFTQLIKPHISGYVLEVGAGIGANTALLHQKAATGWVLLEPDINFCNRLRHLVEVGKLPAYCTIFNGYTSQIRQTFDTIIYIDVLEHIENDVKELKTAAALLNPGGKLIVLSPAYNYLMNPFDKAIGHYRRYTKKELLAKTEGIVEVQKIFYADSLGLLSSLANKWILKQPYPTQRQISFWDTFIIPASTITDKIIFHSAGRSVIGIWKKR